MVKEAAFRQASYHWYRHVLSVVFSEKLANRIGKSNALFFRFVAGLVFLAAATPRGSKIMRHILGMSPCIAVEIENAASQCRNPDPWLRIPQPKKIPFQNRVVKASACEAGLYSTRSRLQGLIEASEVCGFQFQTPYHEFWRTEPYTGTRETIWERLTSMLFRCSQEGMSRQTVALQTLLPGPAHSLKGAPRI